MSAPAVSRIGVAEATSGTVNTDTRPLGGEPGGRAGDPDLSGGSVATCRDRRRRRAAIRREEDTYRDGHVAAFFGRTSVRDPFEGPRSRTKPRGSGGRFTDRRAMIF